MRGARGWWEPSAGCGVGCDVQAVGACWQRAGSEMLGWKPMGLLKTTPQVLSTLWEPAVEEWPHGPCHCTDARAPFSGGQGDLISGSARVPAVSTHSAQMSSGELAGEHSKASQCQSYFLKGKCFIVQFYAAIWCSGHLSRRTVSRLLMAGDVKLQPGQNSSAKVILSSGQRKKCQGANKMLLLKALPGINNLF